MTGTINVSEFEGKKITVLRPDSSLPGKVAVRSASGQLRELSLQELSFAHQY